MDKIVASYIEHRINASSIVRSETHAASEFVSRISGAPAAVAFVEYLKGQGVTEQAKLSELQKEFRNYFSKMLEGFDAAHPGALSDAQKAKFFNKIKKGWIKGEGPKAEVSSSILSQDDLQLLWEKATPVPAAKADVMARWGMEGEMVITTINGEEETRQAIGSEPMVVVKNPTGEVYAISAEKFAEQYDTTGEQMSAVFASFKSRGTRWVVPYDGDNLMLQASWGETQRLNKGDVLACTQADGKNGDVYRIEASAFKTGYTIILDNETAGYWTNEPNVARIRAYVAQIPGSTIPDIVAAVDVSMEEAYKIVTRLVHMKRFYMTFEPDGGKTSYTSWEMRASVIEEDADLSVRFREFDSGRPVGDNGFSPQHVNDKKRLQGVQYDGDNTEHVVDLDTLHVDYADVDFGEESLDFVRE